MNSYFSEFGMTKYSDFSTYNILYDAVVIPSDIGMKQSVFTFLCTDGHILLSDNFKSICPFYYQLFD